VVDYYGDTRDEFTEIIYIDFRRPTNAVALPRALHKRRATRA